MAGCGGGRHSSDEVFIVGDSLTVAALTLSQEMEEHGVELRGVDAANGRTTAQGLDVLEEAAPLLPEAVLVALGTNDVPTATADDVDAWVGRARQLVGDRRLIWVNLHLDPEKADPRTHPGLDERVLARFTEVNEWLDEATDRHDVELADWRDWVEEHDIVTGPDGVHYGRDGYGQRARFYAEVVAGEIATS